MPLIELRNVSKSFDFHHVLRNVNLPVEEGETLALMGRSGIGKSVTLLIITGLLQPDEGQVLIQGRDIAGLPESELISLRKKFSYVFQSGALFDSITVFENVAFPLRTERAMDEVQLEGRVMGILRRLDLEDIADLMPEEISTGMKKRVAMARAIAANPLAIFYDEPTTGVDPITGRLISETIRELQKEMGITSIVVTHDLRCAQTVADRVAFIQEGGRISFHGTVETFIHTDQAEIAQFRTALPRLARPAPTA